MTVYGPLINVLYGSVTGNAEEIARDIHAQLPGKGLPQGLIRSLADHADVPAFVKPANHPDVYNVIVVSTTGDGDPPDSIRPFMRLLRSKDKSCLKGLNFTVLGLGDTNYENFCKTGKRVDAGLPKLGAVRFMKRGDADDGIGLELVVEPWKDSLWAALAQISETFTPKQTPQPDITDKIKQLPSETVSTIEDTVKHITSKELGFDESRLPAVPIPKLNVESVLKTASETEPSVHPSYNSTEVRKAFVKSARLLTAKDADKTVWHVELACEMPSGSSEPLSYRPGDAFGMLVENDQDEVKRFLLVTGANANDMIVVNKQNGDAIATATVERFVRERLDLRAVPSKTLLRVLSEHCEDVSQRKDLLLLSSRDGRKQYTERISGKDFSLLDVLEKLAPSCKAPISVFLDMVPSIPMRWYSATSSPELDGHSVVHFAFSLVENGLGTNALARRCKAMLAGEAVDPVYLLPRESDGTSHFRPPESVDTQYIMIGPGTGVAPFRGFLRERQSILKENGATAVGKTMLFFGCRYSDQDFLYEEDLKTLAETKALSVLDVAFSRETDEKVYVQDRLLARREEVADVIKNDGRIFVCGDGGGMAIGVNKALTTIVTDLVCDGNEDNGKKMMKELAEKHRYVCDIWFHG